MLILEKMLLDNKNQQNVNGICLKLINYFLIIKLINLMI